MFNNKQLELIKKALELHAGSLYTRMDNTTDKDFKQSYQKAIDEIDEIIKLITE